MSNLPFTEVNHRDTLRIPAPPPHAYGLFPIFGVHHEDKIFRNDEVIANSRKALLEYLRLYEEREDRAPDRNKDPKTRPSNYYPLRLKIAGHTLLPAFLNDRNQRDSTKEDLDQEENIAKIATEWLFQELNQRVLFGIKDPQKPDQELRYKSSIKFSNFRSEINATKVAHALYQQYFHQWPVYHGIVTVHLLQGDNRVSVSNSYFPIPEAHQFAEPADPEASKVRALEIAKLVLATTTEFHGTRAIGLFWNLLDAWFAKTQGALALEALDEWRQVCVPKLITALIEFSQNQPNSVLKFLGVLPDELLTFDQSTWLNAYLTKFWNYRDELGIPTWVDGEHCNFTFFEGSELMIVPFAGDYYLAYKIEFITPDHCHGWRIFLDSDSRKALGEPDELSVHTLNYYPSTGARLNGQLQQIPTSLIDLSNNLGRFVNDFEWYTKLNRSSFEDLIQNNGIRGQFDRDEFTNVAVHANELYQHFTDICQVDAGKLHAYPDPEDPQKMIAPGLRVVVGKTGNQLDMGFNPANVRVKGQLQPKVIAFQSDKTTEGLDTNEKKVSAPSLDPEIIYHEFTHAFLWLLNQAAFDPKTDSIPFARALQEGYANYFARSYGERSDPVLPEAPDTPLWARAAYCKSKQVGYKEVGWGEDWSLQRALKIPGEDLFGAPNIYPEIATSGLPVYHVGMIWARALWDVRTLLSTELPELGKDLADRLALRAYPYLVGGLTNFEMAAEGLIDSARSEPKVAQAIDAIIKVFTQRRILMDGSVQALCSVTIDQEERILIGTDQGIQDTSDTAPLAKFHTSDVSPQLQHIVGLATWGNRSYVATENDVYALDFVPTETIQVTSEWSWASPTVRLLCLHANDDHLLVGTTEGIYCQPNSDGSNTWEKITKSTFTSLGITSHYLSTGSSREEVIFSVGLGDVKRVFYSRNNGPWYKLDQIGDNYWPTCVTVRNDYIYAGTQGHGVWWHKIVAEGDHLYFDEWEGDAKFTQKLNGALILCLHVSADNELFVGTALGTVYQATIQDGHSINDWTQIILPTSPAATPVAITTLLSSNERLYVGTAMDGLYIVPLKNEDVLGPGKHIPITV